METALIFSPRWLIKRIQFSGEIRKQMVGVDSDDGSRRRLPSWMLGVSSKSEGTKQCERSENIKEVVKPKAKQQVKEKKSLVLSKCEKEPKRKWNLLQPKNDASDDKSINKVGRTAPETAPQRKKRASSYDLASGNESKITSPLDDSQDLTVEDLIIIAEEYVRGDKDMVTQNLSKKESELARESTAPRNQLGDSNILASGSAVHDSALSLTSEQKITAAGETGDPTQDMLDLFLGPLLKKPVQEKRTEFIEYDMEMEFEFRKSRQDDIGEEIVLLQKKKSSLKEKVLLLLD